MRAITMRRTSVEPARDKYREAGEQERAEEAGSDAGVRKENGRDDGDRYRGEAQKGADELETLADLVACAGHDWLLPITEKACSPRRPGR